MQAHTLAHPTTSDLSRLAPGVGLAVLAAAISVGINHFVPTLSPLLIAIVVGIVVANAIHLSANDQPGIDFSAKHLLRAGIVLLGLQVVLGDVLALGWGMIAVIVAVVTMGLVTAVVAGRLLKISYQQSILIGSGFSICGAAAVAGAEGVIDDADESEVIAAIALVVLFGTIMIPLLPAVAAVVGMPAMQTGLWAGASVHEVAQVVAIGGSISPEALQDAVIVKLTRVLLLAPVMIVLGLVQRRRHTLGLTRPGADGEIHNPPLIQGFVAGFIVSMVIASVGILPATVLAVAKGFQTWLLTAAMFALGTGVTWSRLKSVGGRPVLLAAIITVVVALTAFVGIRLTHPW